MTPEPGRAPRLALLLALMLVLVITGVFWPLHGHQFLLLDDGVNVYDNPYFQPVTWQHILALWCEPYVGLYIPLTYTLWGLIAWLSPFLATQPAVETALSPELFHRLNLLLHLLNGLVVFCLLRVLLHHTGPPQPEGRAGAAEARRTWATAAGALLFALHPLQVEAVAWVSGLKDVLCGLLGLLALWQYLCYASLATDSSGATAQGPPPGRRHWHYGLATAAFALALLAKPTAVILPLVAWLLDTWVLRRRWSQGARALLVWLVAAVAWSLFTKGLQPNTLLTYIPPLWARPLIAGDAVAFYVTKLLLPLHLSPHYGRTPERVLAHVWIYGTGLLPWGLGAWLWWQRQRLPGLATATGVFVLNLLPVLGLIPFGFQGFSTVADRYAYLALLGPAWGLAWGIARSEHHRLVLIGCLTLGIGLGVRTAGQTGYWHDTVTLFAHALRLNPDSYLAHASLGDALAKQHQLDEAARHYRAALRLEPNYPAAHANLGIILRQQGQLEAAITQSRLALQLDPQLAVAHLNLGDTFKQQGKLTEALQHYVAALRLQPNDAKVYIALGVMYAEQDKLTEAITYYTAALRLRPGWSIPYNNLGQVLVKQGKLAEALEQFAQATRYPPLLPESSYNLGLTASKLGRIPTAIAAYREAWHRRPGWLQVANNLAWLLVTQPQPSPSNIAEAIRLAEGATQTAEHQDATVLHTLAVAYAAAARWPEAIQVAARALAYAKATDNADLAAQIRQHLHNYQQQQQATLPLRP